MASEAPADQWQLQVLQLLRNGASFTPEQKELVAVLKLEAERRKLQAEAHLLELQERRSRNAQPDVAPPHPLGAITIGPSSADQERFAEA